MTAASFASKHLAKLAAEDMDLLPVARTDNDLKVMIEVLSATTPDDRALALLHLTRHDIPEYIVDAAVALRGAGYPWIDTARMLGYSCNAVRRRVLMRGPEAVSKVRDAYKSHITEVMWDAAASGLKAVVEKLPEASARDAMWVVGVLMDKIQMLSGTMVAKEKLVESTRFLSSRDVPLVLPHAVDLAGTDGTVPPPSTAMPRPDEKEVDENGRKLSVMTNEERALYHTRNTLRMLERRLVRLRTLEPAGIGSQNDEEAGQAAAPPAEDGGEE